MKAPFRSALDVLAAVAVLVPLALGAVASVHAQENAHARAFDVFVDLPTGFAYVNVPQRGWTYVRQLSNEQMRLLPAGTLTEARPVL